MKKTYSVIYQSVLIGTIVLISKIIESLLPVTMPASVIGLVLMFLALNFNVIKLEQVETVGDALVNNIGLFFVPAGISVIKSLGLLQAHFILDMILIFASTLILLVATGWMTQLIFQLNTTSIFKKSSAFSQTQERNSKVIANSKAFAK
ncbi:antiholin-like murein hydrolase modulator LrgA [Streptococcus porcinus]|uniref:Antiholin-like murein hydrolase modulator LrgA n=1 Tax=Streptococcus porcinus TaxID=1340 RepID=A0A7V9WS46_STRPO|nr:antiholin-like murein hydrolase modulator LrgA [Streptococcus porcinus]MBA2796067.1 antiholin-like murein hydrolase modulator LrgA [Streptococcus porcinus]